MKSALVLGAGGFLGSYIAELCRRLDYKVYGISRGAVHPPGPFSRYIASDIETADLDGLLKDSNIDYCFHFAAPSSVANSIVSPFGDFMGCLPGTARLLDALRRNQPNCHIILASSAAVYGNPVSLPISELSDVSPISPYGCHKLLAENLAKEYSRIYHLRISVMRIFSAYGVGLRKQLLWDACNKTLVALKARDSTVHFSGTGCETRDFIHAQDVAKAALLIAQNESSEFNIYNVGSGQETSIRHIIELIASKLDANVRIEFPGQSCFGVPSNWRADISKLCRIGYTPTSTLEKGVCDYVEWVKHTVKY